jgi:hypothetical protein
MGEGDRDRDSSISKLFDTLKFRGRQASSKGKKGENRAFKYMRLGRHCSFIIREKVRRDSDNRDREIRETGLRCEKVVPLYTELGLSSGESDRFPL